MTTRAGFGTLLCSGSASGSAGYFAGITNISGPALALDTVDRTVMTSPGGWEEVIPTILRSGEVSVDLDYDPSEATHSGSASGGLPYSLIQKSLAYYHIYFPTGQQVTFQAYVTKFEVKAAVEDKLTATAALKITGAMTFS